MIVLVHIGTLETIKKILLFHRHIIISPAVMLAAAFRILTRILYVELLSEIHSRIEK